MTTAELIDAGRDLGDYDLSEVDIIVIDQRHISHKKAEIPALPKPCINARQYLDDIKAMLKKETTKEQRQIFYWNSTPELYRKMAVAAAGLDRTVVNKKHSSLTEQEKAALRHAACDVRTFMEGVGRSL